MKFLLITLFFCSFTSQSQQPWVQDNAVWKYRYEDQSLGGGIGLFKVYKTGNILHNGVLCDELITKRYDYVNSGGWQIYDSVVVDTNYTYLSLSEDSVMYWQNGEFRTLYDFSANVSDSVLIHVDMPDANPCDDSSYAFVTSNDVVNILGTNYRMQTYWKSSSSFDKYTLGGWSIGLGIGINERFGPTSVDIDGFLFPIMDFNCSTSGEHLLFNFLCFQDDSMFYEVDCDYMEMLDVKSVSIDELIVSPNPFKDKIVISGFTEGLKITLLDASGRRMGVYTQNQVKEVDFSYLSPGIYRLILEFDSGRRVKNLVKY